jgi:hypothetical protein
VPIPGKMKTSILVLGDGNFSFSMALSHLLRDVSDVCLVATSFDDAAALEVGPCTEMFPPLTSLRSTANTIARAVSPSFTTSYTCAE